MRRAIIATAGTVVALVAVLDYKSSGALKAGTQIVPTATSSTPSTPSTTASPNSTVAPNTAVSPSTTVAPSTTAPASGQFTGTEVSYQYGTIQARLTIEGGRITSIAFPDETATDPRSESINSQALPILTREVLSAQNLHIDVVSGATYTSDAFAQTLQAALSKAGR